MTNKFLAILMDSFLEIKSRKILYVLGFVLGISLLILVLVFLATPNLEVDGNEIFRPEMLDTDMGGEIYAMMFRKLLGFTLFLLAFGAAWVLPSYLSKGRIELILSKPISRISLLLMKFGAVYLNLIVFLTIMTVTLWLTFSIGLGIFKFGFFSGLLLAYAQFFVIYSVIFFLGLIGNSGALALIGYIVINYAQWIVSGRGIIFNFLEGTNWEYLYIGIYHALPKLEGISDNISLAIQGHPLNFYPIWSSILFAFLILSVSVFIFRRRDY